MKYSVQVHVMPLKELLDPQGKAVLGGLKNLGLSAIEDVRVGKHISLQIEAASEEEARSLAEEASKKLLANAVMEYYEIEVHALNG
ncbi:phosphoribosylformylglycinamidine synthase subunit PurS [Flavisolibacter sp. BT320]|nr:phosphoribosylformylglycinamidine synthase subunit PurS [Flavisolibacter longurius]